MTGLTLHILESIQQWLLSGAPRIYDRRDLELRGNRQILLSSILARYFWSELTINSLPFLMLGMQKMKRNWTAATRMSQDEAS